MLSAVSGVSFRGQQPTAASGMSTEDFQKLIQSEGKFSTKPNADTATAQPAVNKKKAEAAPAKKGKAGKIIGGIIAGIVVAGLALYGLKKGNIITTESSNSFIKKLAEAGNWIDEKMISPVLNLFKGKGAKEAANAAENATKPAADAAADAAATAEDTAKAIFA